MVYIDIGLLFGVFRRVFLMVFWRFCL